MNSQTIEKAGKKLKSLRIEISHSDHAKFKAIAASCGVSMTEATHAAIELWIKQQLNR